MKRILCLSVLFFYCEIGFSLDKSPLRDLFINKEYNSAWEAVQKSQNEKKLSQQKKEKLEIADIIYSFYAGKNKEFKNLVEKHVDKTQIFQPYMNYLKAISSTAQSNLDQAVKSYEEVLAAEDIPYQLKNNVNFNLAKIYIGEAKYSKARKKLLSLERKWRGSFKRHPEVLWNLLKLEIQAKRGWKSCRWARKLYSSYPMHEITSDWGMDLQNVKVKGKKINCVASHINQRSRIKRLQWAGKSAKALREIEKLKKRVTKKTKYDIDSLYARYLINEGYVHKAVDVLLKHYKGQVRNFKYLMLLGKATSRAGEYQTAVGAYYKAYKRKPGTRSARKALYFSAFLSYQFQDYDGASRKFSEFIKKYRRSGLSRDAEYNLSWIRYLKGNYQASAEGFESILRKKKKRWRRWRKYPVQRLKYWMAMSHMRLGQYDKAAPVFFELMGNKFVDYYAVASQHRYNSIPGVQKISQAILHKHRGLASIRSYFNKMAPHRPHFLGDEASQSLSEESEDNMKITAEDEGEEKTPEVDKMVTDQNIRVGLFSNPRLKINIERAKLFSELGLSDWAKWELRQIERRAKHSDDFEKLVELYEFESAFERSSRIGEFQFSDIREEQGVLGNANKFWQFTYPQAYKKEVTQFSQQFGVEKEYIWSIMRAESHYKYDIVSPVGAKGLMQVMPHSGLQISKLLGDRHFQADQLVIPSVNIRLGTKYLQRLLKKFSGNMALATGAYNAGPHRVINWLSSFGHLEMDEFIEHIPFIETRKYVKKVLRYYSVYRLIYSREESRLSWLPQPIKYQMSRRPAYREDWSPLEAN